MVCVQHFVARNVDTKGITAITAEAIVKQVKWQ